MTYCKQLYWTLASYFTKLNKLSLEIIHHDVKAQRITVFALYFQAGLVHSWKGSSCWQYRPHNTTPNTLYTPTPSRIYPLYLSVFLTALKLLSSHPTFVLAFSCVSPSRLPYLLCTVPPAAQPYPLYLINYYQLPIVILSKTLGWADYLHYLLPRNSPWPLALLLPLY